MSVTIDEIEHLASLASLSLDHGSVEQLTNHIASILEFVAQLERVGDAHAPSGSVYSGGTAPLRADQPHRFPFPQPLSTISPVFRDGFFVVPRPSGVGDGP